MKHSTVPDAWDEDWEVQADSAANDDDNKTEHDGETPLQPTPSLTKAERITKHAEANRKVWEFADASPQTFHYLEASNTVPLTSSFKPQVKVLSRQPIIAKRGAASGGMTLSAEYDDDAETKNDRQHTADEIRAKQKRDLEERRRRYDEARAKIFGESNPSSRGSSPGNVTPPKSDGRQLSRGRGRGGGQRSNTNGHEARGQSDTRRAKNQVLNGRELYNPKLSPIADPISQQRRVGEGDTSVNCTPVSNDQYRYQSQYQPPPLSPHYQHRPQQQQQQQAMRSPRGPDGSGRGGFGFARRNNQNI
ncbi:hypothetical protein E4U35_000161 [Claviceps purpurea]|uniref:SUZ domain-containing protein n=1 Tax=Claviceps purpurea (strain 20.1) TaxID=1111077 RepID=M1W6E2_CLAP2|nr:hypothetical protein E4U12_000214 [Claviceps purpurea]CCE34571.1 uncharacterized protein CPUR_08504 [Claviceps purpurea 20.1]KAG6125020.1 hypothetical protein E4U28_001175 [Claviceps purpurea]KAG6148106.1 hypothetical protein E4U37_007601 [Claviceps purpurea]KAG6150626.1 hypothetical protein E4U11_008237 [Claviceps purpurea]